jgi:hypothetical protein
MSSSTAKQNTEILPYPGEDSEGIRVDSDEYDMKHFRAIYMLRKSRKTKGLALSSNNPRSSAKLVTSHPID